MMGQLADSEDYELGHTEVYKRLQETAIRFKLLKLGLPPVSYKLAK